MDVYIGGLPPQTTVAELRRLLGNAAAHGSYRLFRERCGPGRVLCYSLVQLPGEKLACDLIDRLNGLEYHGRPLEVRPYIYRNAHWDRRAPRWRNKPWRGLDRRRCERRASL